MIKYFAYGSLLQGSRYHQYYLGGRPFLGKGVIEGYQKYIFGGLHGIYPEAGRQVAGEVYEIDHPAMVKLEFMHSNFSRGMVEVKMEDGTTLAAETFIWNG